MAVSIDSWNNKMTVFINKNNWSEKSPRHHNEELIPHIIEIKRDP